MVCFESFPFIFNGNPITILFIEYSLIVDFISSIKFGVILRSMVFNGLAKIFKGSEIDITTAAGGDIGGMGTDFLNAVTGLFGGSFSKEREKQKAIINQVNNSIKQPLVKALSDKGSVYTQKTIEQILPQPSDNNQTFVEKSKALVPELQYTLNNLKAQMTSVKTQAELEELRSQFQKIQNYIANVTVAINDYESGSSTNNLLNQADEIVGSGE